MNSNIQTSTIMAYHFSKKLDVSFEEAVENVTAALNENSFGVLTEIDIKATLKEKLDVEFKEYQILGACSPEHAYKALSAEDHIGLMLPCNVIVQEHENGDVEVSAVDPTATMQIIKNKDLEKVIGDVSYLLKKVIDSL